MSKLVDTVAAELATGVKQATIRQWIRRGKLQHYGHDFYGRTIVDLDEFEQVSDRRRAACQTSNRTSH